MENQPYSSSTPHPSSSNDHSLGMWMHLGPLLAILLNVFIPIPFLSLIVAIGLYYMYRDRSTFAKANGIESVNFQITLTIAGFVILFISVLFFGGSMMRMLMGSNAGDEAASESGVMGMVGTSIIVGIIYFLIMLAAIVLMIIGSIRANNGSVYHYPLALRFMK
ncbi:DUF4870 domain-containing protein [Telluribacter sp. SYSU D00476]|uniref:DUF4870 domain-containing protein n=1 Tax=Telluribacter sp. SYSU D00476 TaxID=2811430 RepID=UPI001FF4F0CB|nr:DUF4870 domain-containing protein [Telluribacter sp. SYSU D00476]